MFTLLCDLFYSLLYHFLGVWTPSEFFSFRSTISVKIKSFAGQLTGVLSCVFQLMSKQDLFTVSVVRTSSEVCRCQFLLLQRKAVKPGILIDCLSRAHDKLTNKSWN